MNSHVTSHASPHARFAFRAFAVGCLFFLLSAFIGVLLRWQTMAPLPGLNYAYLLHTHSHVAFLGWVFNAFFALALRFFVPEEQGRLFFRLFIVAQVAVLGMVIAYPLQGYGGASIAFSSLHMVCTGIFAVKLWRSSRVVPAVRGCLRVALAFLFISGLGPLTLGPLAASGLRDSPAYSLSIYFYLHCQYNGWFIFFLLAVLGQWQVEQGATGERPDLQRAIRRLAPGTALTFALSALWLSPPAWVQTIALAGGVVQLTALPPLWRELQRARIRWSSRVTRALAQVALGAFGLKLALQCAGAFPGMIGFAQHRFSVIGFLHLVFLGVVTPLLFALAAENNWLRLHSLAARAGLVLYFVGAATTAVALAWPPLAGAFNWPGLPGLMNHLLGAAISLTAGILCVALALDTRGCPREVS